MDTEILKNPLPKLPNGENIIVLAVPHGVATGMTKAVGSASDGKTVIDVSNAVTGSMELALGFTTSAAEEIQKMLPKAHVVRAINMVFAQDQSTDEIGNKQLILFVAGYDAQAKQMVMQLVADIGFEPADEGPLKAAGYLEPMGVFMISLDYVLGMRPKIGFKLIKG